MLLASIVSFGASAELPESLNGVLELLNQKCKTSMCYEMNKTALEMAYIRGKIDAKKEQVRPSPL